jgi:two-component system nitrogen regulation response regulator GlnG
MTHVCQPLTIAPGIARVANLLLIDDDPDLLPDQVDQVFPAPAHRVEIAPTGSEGLERARDGRPDVILLDLRLPDQSGLDVLKQLRQIDARIPVVLVTAARSADSAIEAMRQGAYDYLLKPLDLQKLDRVIGEALKVARLMREPAVIARTLPDDDQPGEAIVGSCPAMQEVYKAIGRVADQTFPVVITGQSGTGKELVARAIYQHGPRAKAPFLALNCAAIPEALLESELFGHEKGAFTGRNGAASASSSSVTAAPSSSTRSATCRCRPRRSCCGSCRSRRSSASAGARRSRPTCA